ncbi:MULTISPECIES: hypothetical protein [unclassified Haloarcula]|uniref:hypothetical protein n=1 Tax=unclassified Haloarcula TaxID=2624677 RepID=UPI000EF1872B|nr:MULTISPECIES: hypothetical protein [unclassified Haloarcula]RLM34096.1 hypothetical protein DVK01_16640 [Haloarcula sp. Atlit-120R]RLM42329.1 hypothetical protein DVK00_14725 [Haloarcula sp. Atlit-47R]
MIGPFSTDTNSSRPLALLLAGLICASMAVAGVGGAAAATTETATPTETSTSDTLADKTVAVDNQTQQVYLEVTNTSGQSVDYTVYGVSDGITTQVDSGQVSAADGETTEKTFAVDSSEYDSYRIVVEEDGTDSDSESAESIEIGEIVQQESGGAIFGGGGDGLLTPMNILIAALLGAAAFVLGLFDPIKRRIAG